MEQKQPKKEQEIKIEMDKQIAQGIYSNYAMVSHRAEEFVLDFIFIQPQPTDPKLGTLRARIITSPEHMKRIHHALRDNIAKYERKYGEITESKAPGEGQTSQVQ